MMTAGAFGIANKIVDLLQQLVDSRDLPTDYDVTTVVSCNAGNGYQCVPIALPRTLRYVEIEMSGVNTNSAAEGAVLFAGNVSSAVAAQQIGFPAAGAASSAICATGGGKVTVRTHLDGSGYLTLCFISVATPMIINVRVVSLDPAPPPIGTL